MRTVLRITGWIALLLGAAGVVLPLLPTTPLVLLAAWCFVRSDERLAQWLREHPRFGPLISNWREHRVVPLHAKLLATVMLLTSVSYALLCPTSPMPMVGAAVFTVMAAGLIVFLAICPSRAPTA